MAEASIKLANGTTVNVSGTPEEIARIVSLYNDSSKAEPSGHGGSRRNAETSSDFEKTQKTEVDISDIVNTINDCDEAENIEKHVLDKPDVINRILMPLYINEKYFGSQPKLTTGEISKVLGQLGTPVLTPNVSNAISQKAKRYVMADSVRTKGAAVRYSISRRGQRYFEEVLSGQSVVADRHTSPKKKKSTPTFNSVEKSNAKDTSKKQKPSGYRPKFNASLDLLKLETFFKSYTLNNNSEFVVAFTKFLRDEVGLEIINGDDIYTCFDELKALIKLPGSFMNTLRNAQNRDHLISYESGFTKVALTPRGENLFNHDIVDRETN